MLRYPADAATLQSESIDSRALSGIADTCEDIHRLARAVRAPRGRD